MTQNNNLNVKLPRKFKSGRKNITEVTSNILFDVIGDSNDEPN